MRHRQAAERAAVKRALERHDEAAVAVARRHHAIEQHGLDRVLHRLGAGVDDEVARRPGRRDAVQLGLEPQRQRGLVLRVRVARDRRTAAIRARPGPPPDRSRRTPGWRSARPCRGSGTARRRRRDRRSRGTGRPIRAGSNATGSEKNRLRDAASSAACEAGRCCATSSSSGAALSRSSSGTWACISPARYRRLSSVTRPSQSETCGTTASNTFTTAMLILRRF